MPARIKSKDLNKHPNGTLLRKKRRLYCLTAGLEGRIITDVDEGAWFFLKDFQEKNESYELVFQPPTVWPPYARFPDDISIKCLHKKLQKSYAKFLEKQAIIQGIKK